MPILAARRKKDTTIAADEVNTEVVQRHLWLWPCVLDLFNHADTTAEALKSNFRCMDESLQKILREMSLAVYAMVLVSTGRIIWLLRKPESVDPWSLRILKGQAIELKTLIEVHGKKLQDIQDGFPECNQVMHALLSPAGLDFSFPPSTSICVIAYYDTYSLLPPLCMRERLKHNALH